MIVADPKSLIRGLWPRHSAHHLRSWPATTSASRSNPKPAKKLFGRAATRSSDRLRATGALYRERAVAALSVVAFSAAGSRLASRAVTNHPARRHYRRTGPPPSVRLGRVRPWRAAPG